MANVKLVFYGDSELSDTELTCHQNNLNQIFIELSSDGYPSSWIVLDKSTAIKFAKTLRTEINKMT